MVRNKVVKRATLRRFFIIIWIYLETIYFILYRVRGRCRNRLHAFSLRWPWGDTVHIGSWTLAEQLVTIGRRKDTEAERLREALEENRQAMIARNEPELTLEEQPERVSWMRWVWGAVRRLTLVAIVSPAGIVIRRWIWVEAKNDACSTCPSSETRGSNTRVSTLRKCW